MHCIIIIRFGLTAALLGIWVEKVTKYTSIYIININKKEKLLRLFVDNNWKTISHMPSNNEVSN